MILQSIDKNLYALLCSFLGTRIQLFDQLEKICQNTAKKKLVSKKELRCVGLEQFNAVMRVVLTLTNAMVMPKLLKHSRQNLAGLAS